MEPIEVTAHFDEKGTITPQRFTWKGSLHRVESTGRRWLDEKGQHILVMLSTGRIFELIYQAGQGRWYIEESKPERRVV